MEKITSRANPRIKSAAALSEAKERRRRGCFLLEGVRLCVDAVLNGASIREFFITENAAEKNPDAFKAIQRVAQQSFYIDEGVAEKLSDTQSTQQIFCVCEAKDNKLILRPDGLYVMTDRVQNPDNLGAVVRSAEALGFDGLIVNGGCDIYSPKAQRAAMGALLRFPVMQLADALTVLDEMKALGIAAFATVADETALDIRTAKTSGGAVLIIGNEGSGVSDEIKNIADGLITIPMAGKAESLNAAAAAAIAMWEFVREKQ